LSLRDRGVKAAKLAVGDGGLGLWSALAEVYVRQTNWRKGSRWKSGGRGAARLAAVLAGESPAGAILSLAP